MRTVEDLLAQLPDSMDVWSRLAFAQVFRDMVEKEKADWELIEDDCE